MKLYSYFFVLSISLNLAYSSLSLDPPAYRELKVIKELYDDGIPPNQLIVMLDRIDFRDDEMEDIDDDRNDAALSWLRFNDPDKARELLSLNLLSNSPNVEFPFRVRSLIMAHVFKCADENWIRQHLFRLNHQRLSPDFDSLIGLISLNCLYNTTEETLDIWRIFRIVLQVHFTDEEIASQANNMWQRYEKKYKVLGVEKENFNTNPFLLDDPYAIYIYWERLTNAHYHICLFRLGRAPQGMELPSD